MKVTHLLETAVSHQTLFRFLMNIEPRLMHEARRKDFDIDEYTHKIFWVTQETTDLQSLETANKIAEELTNKGWTGWAVHVICRDKRSGPRDSIPWQVAHS